MRTPTQSLPASVQCDYASSHVEILDSRQAGVCIRSFRIPDRGCMQNAFGQIAITIGVFTGYLLTIIGATERVEVVGRARVSTP